jgi:hypothetical protein
MKKSAAKLFRVCGILAFVSFLTVSAQAETYYYFTTMEGLMDSPDAYPFCEIDDCTYPGNVEMTITEKSPTLSTGVDVENSYSLVNPDVSVVEVTAESDNESIISSLDIDIDETAKTISVVSADIGGEGTVRITLTATVGEDVVDQDYFDVTISDYLCDVSAPLSGIGFEQVDWGGSLGTKTTFLLGTTTSDDAPSSDKAKKQMLCISNHQSISTSVTTINGSESYTPITASYKLTANVSFESNPDNEDWDGDGTADGSGAEGWNPIATFSDEFIGNFDGDNHTIDNFYINKDATTPEYSALFAYTLNSVIKDLNFTGVDITLNATTSAVSSVSYVGSLVGFAHNTDVRNVSVKGSVDVSGTVDVGLMIGRFFNSSMEDCEADGSVTVEDSPRSFSGLLAGSGSGSNSAYRSHSSGSVSIVDTATFINQGGASSSAGGLFGSSAGDIENCYSTASVQIDGLLNKRYTGGLAGIHMLGDVVNSYSTGSVSNLQSAAENYLGGLIGVIYKGDVKNSYSYYSTAPSVVGSTTNVGALIGFDWGPGYGQAAAVIHNDGLCDQLGTLTGYTCNNGGETALADIRTIQQHVDAGVEAWDDTIWNNVGVSGSASPTLK